MASKIGVMFSLIFFFYAFLFASDFVMIQLTYTSLDALSTTISYRISKTGEINDDLKKFVKEEINADIKPVGASASYEEGSMLGYYLIKEYKPIAYDSEPLELKIRRYAVINIYRWFLIKGGFKLCQKLKVNY